MKSCMTMAENCANCGWRVASSDRFCGQCATIHVNPPMTSAWNQQPNVGTNANVTYNQFNYQNQPLPNNPLFQQAIGYVPANYAAMWPNQPQYGPPAYPSLWQQTPKDDLFHHALLFHPGWSEGQKRWPPALLISRIYHISSDGDKKELQKLKKYYRSAKRDDERVLMVKACWELLYGYIEHWTPDLLSHEEISRDLRNFFRDRVQTHYNRKGRKPLQHVAPIGAEGTMRRFEFRADRLDFVPRHRTDIFGLSGNDTASKNHHKFSRAARRHPQVYPKTDREAAAHLKDWAKYTSDRLADEVVEHFGIWTGGECDRLFYLTRKLGRRQASRPKALEWANIAREVVLDQLNLVRVVCEQYLGWAQKLTEEGSVALDLARFEECHEALRHAYRTYEVALEELITQRFKDTDLGTLVTFIIPGTFNDGSEWSCLRGGSLPSESSIPACLPRMVWTETFEKYLSDVKHIPADQIWAVGIEIDTPESDIDDEHND